MKKLLMLALFVLLCACSSDDNADDATSNQLLIEILGRWENFQRIEGNQVTDFDECNRDTFNFQDDLSGNYIINTGALINGNCVGGGGGFGFTYEASGDSTLTIIILGIDAFIVNRDGDQIFLNPIDDGTAIDTNIRLLLRRIE